MKVARFVMTSKVAVFLLVSFCCSELFSNGPFVAAAPSRTPKTASTTTSKKPSTTPTTRSSTKVASTTTSKKPSTTPTTRSSTKVASTTTSKRPSTTPTFRNSTVPNCKPTWTRTRSSAVFRSVAPPLEVPASNVAECQAACLANLTCQSIDYYDPPVGESGFQRCYLYTDHGELTGFLVTDHYDLTRPTGSCATTSKGPTTTSQATISMRSSSYTVIPTVSDFSPILNSTRTDISDCKPTWTRTRGSAVFRSVAPPLEVPASNVAECEAACLANLTCQSIDYYDPPVGESGFQRCYLYTDHGNLTSFANTDHYDLTRPTGSCASATRPTSEEPSTIPISQDCQPTWKKTSESAVFQSAAPPFRFTAGDVADCEAACLASTTCQSIDFFDPNVGELGFTQCSLYTDHGNLTSFPNTDHYDLTRPTGSCAPPMPS